MTVKPKPKYRAVAVALFGATVLLLFLWVRKQREPHYEEKPLGFWIKALYDTRIMLPGGSDREISYSKVNVALVALGPYSAPAAAEALDERPETPKALLEFLLREPLWLAAVVVGSCS